MDNESIFSSCVEYMETEGALFDNPKAQFLKDFLQKDGLNIDGIESLRIEYANQCEFVSKILIDKRKYSREEYIEFMNSLGKLSHFEHSVLSFYK